MCELEESAKVPCILSVETPRRPLVVRALGRAWRAMDGLVLRRRLAGFGPWSYIQRPRFIVGGRAIHIGTGVQIWRFARIEAFPSSTGEPVITIGNGTVIQPYVHIGAVRSVDIGSQVLIASGVYITDHDHDWRNPAEPAMSNRRVIACPVKICDRVWIGEGVAILKGTTIGEGSIVGAGSVVTRDIPACSVAVGAPARVVKRYEWGTSTWVKCNEDASPALGQSSGRSSAVFPML